MKRLVCLVLIAAFAALAGDFAGTSAPVRKPSGGPEPLQPSFTNRLGMKFVWIPPGHFIMGSPKEEPERQPIPDEPQHKVTLTKGFYMGVYLVTQEQWQTVTGRNPSYFKGDKNLPVEHISWHDCQRFLAKLRETDDKPYRLPTEAEWEYSCRAGTTTTFFFGTTISTDQANFNGTFPYTGSKKGVFRNQTTPVGSFPANPWGLFDMHGNLLQWCQDWAGSYPQQDVSDPKGPENGTERILRGGPYNFYGGSLRSASRYPMRPDIGNASAGVRVCFFAD
jgi:formylglycine-generating enzyme required for sulfatase activity